MIRSSRVFSRLTAGLAAVAMAAVAGPAPLCAQVASPPPASLSGRIFLSDARTPVRNAVVKAFHHETEQVFESRASGPDGAYVLEGLVPGEYDLGVSTETGIYLVERSLKVAPGQTRAASFALQPYAQQDQGDKSATEGKAEGGRKGTDRQGKAEQPEKKRKRRGGGAVIGSRKGLAATAIVLGGALVIGVLANNIAGDNDGSPNR